MSLKTTHQRAQISIVNNTGSKLISVGIAHKYSDVFKNDLQWQNLNNGQSGNAQWVDYNTGTFTTGRDWWVVVFVDSNGHSYMTDPANFRALFDAAEKALGPTLNALAPLAAAIATGDPEPTTKAIAIATAATAAACSLLLNNEGTDGYKQHILRDEDAGAVTRIVLTLSDVTFNSPSGTSTTGVRRIA